MTSEQALMHQDHDDRQADYAVWFDDLSLWRQQHRDALEMLADIQVRIIEGGDFLEEHERSIRSLGELTERRDRVLVHQASDSKPHLVTPLSHVQVNLDHEGVAVTHQEIRRRHLAVLNEIARLLDKVKNHLSGEL